MLIASLSIGDTLVTLVKVIPLDREELATGDPTYNLSFTDIPTDKHYTKSFVGENNAMQALAAWIAADNPVGNIVLGSKLLQDDPAIMKDFMP